MGAPEHLLQHPALVGEGRPHRPSRELAGGDATAQQAAGDRAGGGADDDLGAAGIPSVVVLEGGEDACVVRLADDAAGAEDESYASHGPTTFRGSWGPPTPVRVTSSTLRRDL